MRSRNIPQKKKAQLELASLSWTPGKRENCPLDIGICLVLQFLADYNSNSAMKDTP